MLGDVQELEVGSFRLAYCHRGRMLTGPLRLELLGVGLRHNSAVRQAGEDVDALEADRAASVADERDLPALQRLLGARRSLVCADDQVDVRVPLEHGLRVLE